jgi:hypothetical protein
MSAGLEAIFENLRRNRYKITSPEDGQYNCIAFAAGEIYRWWWPIDYYWPDGVPRAETLQSFILAFSTLGYSPCEDGTLETRFEKVAIYADEDGTPSHMARQLQSGIWISKCGGLEDIEHEALEALEGMEYGTVVLFLRRPR